MNVKVGDNGDNGIMGNLVMSLALDWTSVKETVTREWGICLSLA